MFEIAVFFVSLAIVVLGLCVEPEVRMQVWGVRVSWAGNETGIREVSS